MRVGLAKIGLSTINAMAEAVGTKPVFREGVQKPGGGQFDCNELLGPRFQELARPLDRLLGPRHIVQELMQCAIGFL